MIAMQTLRPLRVLRQILMACAALAAGSAFAVPLPPSQFLFDVTQGGTTAPGCTPFGGGSVGGTCGSQTSGPGYAATSGGIGTASYLPVTPGGTVLGTGTAVDASSTWTSGSSVYSVASMTYSFEATGPASVDFMPIDVISTGLESSFGDSATLLSLVIRDAGTDANIPPGVPDPDPSQPLLSLSGFCVDGSCLSAWGTPGQQRTDLICVVNGDNYEVTITAATRAARGLPGTSDTASAVLDPVIKFDPPYPTSCPVGVSLNDLDLQTSPGSSTGLVAVPEPGALGLAMIAALGLLLVSRRRAFARCAADGALTGASRPS
jgi:hypothetical protein